MIYYGPWEDLSFAQTPHYIRRKLGYTSQDYYVYFSTGKWFSSLYKDPGHTTCEEAIKEIDELFIGKENCIFLSQEQFDKLKVLL